MAQKSGKCEGCGKRTTRKQGRDFFFCLPCVKESWADQQAEDASMNRAYEQYEQWQSDLAESLNTY